METSKKSILIVDDDPIVAKLVEMRLSKMGYEVAAITSTGNEAISLAALMSPDAVIMDIKIAGEIDGIETAKIITRDYNIPVIYLTADTDLSTFDRAKATAGCEYLVKPFSDSEMYIAIELALQAHEYNMRTRKTQSYFSGIVKSMFEAVIVVDCDGSVVFMNRAAEKLTGTRVSGDLHVRDVVRIGSSSGRTIEDPFEKVLRTGMAWLFPDDAVLTGPDEKPIPVAGSVAPQRNGDATVEGIIISIFSKSRMNVLEYV